MRPWRRRTKAQKTEHTMTALLELGISTAILSVGLLLILAGNLWLTQFGVIWWIGLLLAVLGAYSVGQSIIGLLIEATFGMDAAIALLILVIFGFLIYQGYGLLVE